MNNKGFAITGIVYGILLLFVLVIASFLSVLVGRNRRMDDLLEGVRESLVYEEITVELDDNNQFGINAYQENLDVYKTSKRGKYKFVFKNGTNCVTYLPKNVVIINNNLKTDGENNKLYYYQVYEGHKESDKTENYEELKCIPQ